MNPIIVSTDFSKHSVNAANYAADMAVSINADIILLHVIQIPATTFQVPMTEFEYDEIERSAEELLEKLQIELVQRTKNKIKISKEIRYGSVELEVEKMSYEKKPFAIVIGRRSVNAWQRVLMGSNALRLVHRILYPVLMVPEEASFSAIKNVTIASDLHDDRETTSILFTKKILHAFHVSPKIIHVNTNHNSGNSIHDGIDSLQSGFADFHPSFYFITKENVQSGVADFLKTNKTDLLIVMPEKHGFLESIVQPSETNRIILHSNLPILSVAVTKLPPASVRTEEVPRAGCVALMNMNKKLTEESN